VTFASELVIAGYVLREGEESPNDPKLSDGGGLAQPVRAKAARVGCVAWRQAWSRVSGGRVGVAGSTGCDSPEPFAAAPG
jgi:hypothetical protein